MRTIAIIQARMGSRRLPGKVLADLAGFSMLGRVVRRTRRARYLDDVVVATGDHPTDQPIVDECNRLDVACFRGNPLDVLDRYYQAARQFEAEAVVRITSDCPLIEPEIVERVLERFYSLEPDYGSNIIHRTYPRGLDTEAMSFEALKTAWREAQQDYERTHVTAHIYGHPERFRLCSVVNPVDFSIYRWTVDEADDLSLIRQVYQSFGGDDDFSWREALALFCAEPRLGQTNGHVRHKALVEG